MINRELTLGWKDQWIVKGGFAYTLRGGWNYGDSRGAQKIIAYENSVGLSLGRRF